jgi:hypothetical protein
MFSSKFTQNDLLVATSSSSPLLFPSSNYCSVSAPLTCLYFAYFLLLSYLEMYLHPSCFFHFNKRFTRTGILPACTCGTSGMDLIKKRMVRGLQSAPWAHWWGCYFCVSGVELRVSAYHHLSHDPSPLVVDLLNMAV